MKHISDSKYHKLVEIEGDNECFMNGGRSVLKQRHLFFSLHSVPPLLCKSGNIFLDIDNPYHHTGMHSFSNKNEVYYQGLLLDCIHHRDH